MEETAPPLAVDSVKNAVSSALRAKSPEPPMPLTMRVPMTFVEFTLP